MHPHPNSSLEQKVEEKQTKRADRLNNALESILGIPTDIFTGLDPMAIVISRSMNAVIGYCTGHIYGGVRDKTYQRYHITKASPPHQRYLASLAIFNLIQTPIYGITTFVTCAIQSGFNEKALSTAAQGMKTLFFISLVTAPLKAVYTDVVRKLFSVPTAQEKVDKSYLG